MELTLFECAALQYVKTTLAGLMLHPRSYRLRVAKQPLTGDLADNNDYVS